MSEIEICFAGIRDRISAAAGCDMGVEHIVDAIRTGGDQVFVDGFDTMVWVRTPDAASEVLVRLYRAVPSGPYLALDIYGCAAATICRPPVSLPVPSTPRVCDDPLVDDAIAACGLAREAILQRLYDAQVRLRSLGFTGRKAIGARVPIVAPSGAGVTARLITVSPWTCWWAVDPVVHQGAQDGNILLSGPRGVPRYFSIYDRRGSWPRTSAAS